MTSASSLAFPGSRTLATWWRQLAPFHPQAFAVGYLFIHRLEAQACWLLPQPLDPLLHHVLEALVLEQNQGGSHQPFMSRLSKRLNLEIPILSQLVHSLKQMDLIVAKTSKSFLDTTWDLTEQGQKALQTKNVWSRQWKRGNFSFLERLGPTGLRLTPAHYLKILDAPSTPWLVEESVAFQGNWLHECLNQSPEWKKTFGFPIELLAFPPLPSDRGAAIPWDQILLDRPERLLAVLVQGPKPQEELLGFGVRSEGWVLNTTEPIIRLPANGHVLTPDWHGPSTLEFYKQAWQSWCQTRTVPSALVHECGLSLVGECLYVKAPEALIQSLTAAKSDVFKGDTWILAGDGYERLAARLEVNA